MFFSTEKERAAIFTWHNWWWGGPLEGAVISRGSREGKVTGKDCGRGRERRLQRQLHQFNLTSSHVFCLSLSWKHYLYLWHAHLNCYSVRLTKSCWSLSFKGNQEEDVKECRREKWLRRLEDKRNSRDEDHLGKPKQTQVKSLDR